MNNQSWKRYPDYGFKANKIYYCIQNAEKNGYPTKFNLVDGYVIKKTDDTYENRWYVEGPTGCRSHTYPVWYIHDVLDLFESCMRQENSKLWLV